MRCLAKIVVLRESGVSSTPQLFHSITNASEYWIARLRGRRRLRAWRVRIHQTRVHALAAPDVILASWYGKKVVPDKIRKRPGWNEIPAVRHDRIVEIKSPLILRPGPAALTDGLDAIVKALWPALPGS
jgi:hypothetical protein